MGRLSRCRTCLLNYLFKWHSWVAVLPISFPFSFFHVRQESGSFFSLCGRLHGQKKCFWVTEREREKEVVRWNDRRKSEPTRMPSHVCVPWHVATNPADRYQGHVEALFPHLCFLRLKKRLLSVCLCTEGFAELEGYTLSKDRVRKTKWQSKKYTVKLICHWTFHTVATQTVFYTVLKGKVCCLQTASCI